MWAVVKKKPLVRTLHATSCGGDLGEGGGVEGEVEGVGKGEAEGVGKGEVEGVRKGEGVGKGWVTAVAAFPNSDLVASGVVLFAVPKCQLFSQNV